MRVTKLLGSSASAASQLTSRSVRNGITKSLQPIRHRLVETRRVALSNLFNPSPQQRKDAVVPFSPLPLGLQPQISVGGPVGFLNSSPLPLLYAATLAPPMVPAVSGVSFFKFLLVFIAGGLFFSTAIAVVTACYAVGMDNVQRILNLVGIILEKVWVTFTLGLSATKLALLGKEEDQLTFDQALEESRKKRKKSWNWRSAWVVLKEQLGETRRTAAQGVQALRQEAKLYAAAVGQPGLIPLQYVVDRLMPWSLSAIMEDSIRKTLADFPKQKTIKKMTLSSFSAGRKAPVLEAARVYDVKDAMAFDLAIKWDSQLDASVQIYSAGGLARVPVSLKNMKFEGTVRVVLAPLVKQAPGYGAILMSLARPPKINMDIKVLGGELTKLPFLRHEITAAIQKAITDQLLWPRRTVVPTMIEGTRRPILSPKQLAMLETTDPLLEAEQALAEEPMLRPMHDTTAPIKDKKRMFRLHADNNNDISDNPLTKVVQHHHDVERGIVLGRLQNLFGTKAYETTESNTIPMHNSTVLA